MKWKKKLYLNFFKYTYNFLNREMLKKFRLFNFLCDDDDDDDDGDDGNEDISYIYCYILQIDFLLVSLCNE